MLKVKMYRGRSSIESSFPRSSHRKSILYACQALCLICGLSATSAAQTVQTPVNKEVEKGQVQWSRDLDQAQKEAAQTGKPVLVLFQEIPGCQTCKGFGAGPLSNPIVVEAIESEFHPVVVYNNRSGKDADILKAFGEPSWNNPVIRFLGEDGSDLIRRRDRVWSTVGTVRRMIASLEAAKKEVPFYLRSLIAPVDNVKTATFAMHCFWEGEAKLGSIDGVVSTHSGWLSGLEVVTVVYQPAVVSYETLLKTAQTFECASRVFAHDEAQLKTARSVVGAKATLFPSGGETRDAKASDQKYYLASTALIHVPLTEMQATKLNSAIKMGDELTPWLSARQLAIAKQVAAIKTGNKNAFAGMVYPRDAERLFEYQSKLLQQIESITRPSNR